MRKKMEQMFKEKFVSEELHYFFAPGRINLIGEHTDYNGGHVFPCSITLGTYGVASRRNDRQVNLYSGNFPEAGVMSFSLDDLSYNKAHDWANYPKGMLRFLKEAGHGIETGFDMVVFGNIPNGAGLSSSASIELLTGVALNEMFGLGCEMLELVKLGKKVENEFIGVNSGIMDQFAIGMGKKDQAILLDCNTLEYELVPVKLGKYFVMIMNTNKRRELADSKYNERRGECEEALRRLQTKLAIGALGELDETAFEKNRSLIGDDVLERRAKHAVYENQRTLHAKEALVENDLVTFGQLLNASHQSLKDDYEVTGIELDTLVAAAQQQPGVLGARMTGAGFGGCAIALVEETQAENFKKNVGQLYAEKIGYEADFYPAHIHDGAGIWK